MREEGREGGRGREEEGGREGGREAVDYLSYHSQYLDSLIHH